MVTVDGVIYAAGGVSDEDPDQQFRSELLVIDPGIGRWEELAPMPTGRESCGITVLDGKVYTFGGRSPLYRDSNEVYDICGESRYPSWANHDNRRGADCAGKGCRGVGKIPASSRAMSGEGEIFCVGKFGKPSRNDFLTRRGQKDHSL